MKKIILLFLTVLIISGCARDPLATDEPSDGLPSPVVSMQEVPDVEEFMDRYYAFWNANDYASMYQLLSKTSKDAISEEDFAKFYQESTSAMTLNTVDAGVTSSLINPASAKVGLKVNYSTNLFGIISRDIATELVIESGEWRVQWEEGNILPELSGGNRLMANIQMPNRGDINDRNGTTLVTQTQAVSVGVIPGELAFEYETHLLDLLTLSMRKPKNVIAGMYRNSGEWYVPLGEITEEVYEERKTSFDAYSGFVAYPYTSRYYFSGGIAPQVLGYMRSIFPEEVSEYGRLGYPQDARIGAAGVELWAEPYLAGKPAADLYVVKPDGTYETRLANVDPQAPDTVSLTIDRDFQFQVQRALLGFSGAIVVMELDTGRILAMASSPEFDPNFMQPENFNFQYGYETIINDTEGAPLWNRATQSAYPLGSVFKLITAAAALESGLYETTSIYECTSQYTELDGFVGDDWTLDKGLPPSGTLNLLEGLMRSCNPWFYHLGLDLYQKMGATYLSDMARGFGLGADTGIGVLQEETGSIQDPTTDGAAVQMGIGQGDMLVTPIQVVDFIAAIANGGTLYRPQVIEKITAISGENVYTFKPEVRGTLPVSEETIAALQEGMRMVVEEERGTAHSVFRGMDTKIYGKTGTATTSIIDPHSWFAGYTDMNLPDKPDIAVVVIAENAGDGSRYAAPIFKRVIQDYYIGEPTTLYHWEYDYYITLTPTLEEEDTP